MSFHLIGLSTSTGSILSVCWPPRWGRRNQLPGTAQELSKRARAPWLSPQGLRGKRGFYESVTPLKEQSRCVGNAQTREWHRACNQYEYALEQPCGALSPSERHAAYHKYA